VKFTSKQIYVSVFKNATSIVFANETIQVHFSFCSSINKYTNQKIQIPENGVKYAMKIYEWPFVTLSNALEITFNSVVTSESGNECKTTEASTDDSDNLRWLKIQLNGVILYLPFLHFIYFYFVIYWLFSYLL
jgi:hypothetical protein